MRWRNFQLGDRLSANANGGCRLAYDLEHHRLVNLRLYVQTSPSPSSPLTLLESVGPDRSLARPLAVIEEGNGAVVVRELVFGPGLDWLIQRRRQPAPMVVGLLTSLLQGLSALHRSGVAHLRLLPESVVFDLSSGGLKVTDLERARVEPVRLLPVGLADAYLAPEIRRTGTSDEGGPAADVYGVGRLAQALLLGNAQPRNLPASNAIWPKGWGSSEIELWRWASRCQEPNPAERPRDGSEALTALQAVGIQASSTIQLPLGSWSRRHAMAVRQLRRWREVPPSADAPSGLGYRELLSSRQASIWWRRVGVAAGGALALSGLLLFRPAPGALRKEPNFGEEGCLESAKARPLPPQQSATDGGFRLTVQEAAAASALAIDGCPVELDTEGISLAVTPGRHWVRARVENRSRVAEKLWLSESSLSLDTLKGGADGGPAARDFGTRLAALRNDSSLGESALARDGGTAAPAAAWDPIANALVDLETGQLVVLARGLSLQARASLPDDLALTLDGLQAAWERLELSEQGCRARLAARASALLAVRFPTSSAASSMALTDAAIFLTSTRLSAGQPDNTLKLERQGLARLGVSQSPLLTGIVDQLAAAPEVRSCLEPLLTRAGEVDELAKRLWSQVQPDESDEASDRGER